MLVLRSVYRQVSRAFQPTPKPKIVSSWESHLMRYTLPLTAPDTWVKLTRLTDCTLHAAVPPWTSMSQNRYEISCYSQLYCNWTYCSIVWTWYSTRVVEILYSIPWPHQVRAANRYLLAHGTPTAIERNCANPSQTVHALRSRTMNDRQVQTSEIITVQ